MASQIQVPDAMVGVVVYARAREVYYATYRINYENGVFYPTLVDDIIDLEVDVLVDRLLKESAANYYLVGDGITKFPTQFERLQGLYHLPKPIFCSLSAKNVALLGLRRYYNDDVMTCYDHKPYYHKKSQAEREYEEKNT